jgi:hypothetical protein
MPFANPRIKNGTMEDQVMLKTLLAVVMGLVYLTAHASQLVRLDVDQKANSYAIYVVMSLTRHPDRLRPS